MTTYDPEDQAERRRVLANDARVRDQSRNGDTSAFIDHYSPELGGGMLCISDGSRPGPHRSQGPLASLHRASLY
jgi:hypothetical protein